MKRTFAAGVGTILILAAATGVISCGGGGGGGGNGTTPSGGFTNLIWPAGTYNDVQSVFNSNCTGCHGPNGGLSLASPGSYANLVNQPTQTSVADTRVVPGDAGNSALWIRVSGTAGQMPPGGLIPLASRNEIMKWIDEGAAQDLRVGFSGMDAHFAGTPDVLEGRIVSVSGSTVTLHARMVVDPIPAAAFTVFVPRGLPGEVLGSTWLDLTVDFNENGSYDAPPTDHSWSTEAPSDGSLSFLHNTSFTDIGAAADVEPGNDLSLGFSDMDPHVGQLMGLSVRDGNGKLVGLYWLGQIPGPLFTVSIPGILASGVQYDIDFFADLSGNGTYDAPPADHAWRITETALTDGIDASFAHTTDFTDISQ